MKIKTISGGVRGQANTGTAFIYNIEKETFLSLVGKVFDREVEDYKEENVKAGGMISQFLHAYGVSAEKMEKSGLNPFPETDGDFTDTNVQSWFEAIDFETPRQKKIAVPLEQRQAKWDGLNAKMSQFMSTEEIESAIGKRPSK